MGADWIGTPPSADGPAGCGARTGRGLRKWLGRACTADRADRFAGGGHDGAEHSAALEQAARP